jgi:hypothetical protein
MCENYNIFIKDSLAIFKILIYSNIDILEYLIKKYKFNIDEYLIFFRNMDQNIKNRIRNMYISNDFIIPSYLN